MDVFDTDSDYANHPPPTDSEAEYEPLPVYVSSSTSLATMSNRGGRAPANMLHSRSGSRETLLENEDLVNQAIFCSVALLVHHDVRRAVPGQRDVCAGIRVLSCRNLVLGVWVSVVLDSGRAHGAVDRDVRDPGSHSADAEHVAPDRCSCGSADVHVQQQAERVLLAGVDPDQLRADAHLHHPELCHVQSASGPPFAGQRRAEAAQQGAAHRGPLQHHRFRRGAHWAG
ncbi:hypothetical protein KL930_000038 [Ogataea haglerorum]|nr:hypothetical protein KL951_002482 [Ogataea haglerorum]KAG7701509.1 hypothetical protein KL915_000540 [Ogataea haglerorum]KAG7706728.1 hypothetical protein KL950_003393 [Ogataea haglerorum]KAG7709467.1 hypothetical protein KL914_001857 [Ogataea haglerorum]KAG7732858.1 hypothetical protein KL948_001361 [Ogataea haglerorum]